MLKLGIADRLLEVVEVIEQFLDGEAQIVGDIFPRRRIDCARFCAHPFSVRSAISSASTA